MLDSAESRPAPSANGTLAKTPLVHLLLYVLDKKLSGSLELAAPDGRAASVVLVGGQPAKVRTIEPALRLGRVLADLGLIAEEPLTRALAELAKPRASGPRLLGEVLVAQGALDAVRLRRGLHEQLARRLGHCAGMPPDTAYSYFDGFDALKGWGGAAAEGIDPFGVLWGIVREAPPWQHVQAAIARVGGSALRLRGDDLSRLGLTGGELAAATLLRARPMPAADLARAGQLDERTGQLLIYLLLATKQIDVLPAQARPPPRPPVVAERPARPGPGAPTAPTLPASPPAPRAPSLAPGPRPQGRAPVAAMPPGLSPEHAERWKEIVGRAATIDRADYFGMLDVARDATTEEIESAYFALAKVWHPDRLPADLAAVRDPCARVFGRMSEARQTLTDEKMRGRYMKLLAEGSGSPETQETVARVVDASTQFQKAEVYFKRNDLVMAEEGVRRAIELDPTQPDYHAMLAWLIACKPESQSGQATLQAIRMLDRAVAMSDRSEKAFFWRGLLYKRLGKIDLSVRDFQKAFELNPRNIDAAREVRLHTMRGGAAGAEKGHSSRPAGKSKDSSPPPPRTEDKPGLLGRLFKKS